MSNQSDSLISTMLDHDPVIEAELSSVISDACGDLTQIESITDPDEGSRRDSIVKYFVKTDTDLDVIVRPLPCGSNRHSSNNFGQAHSATLRGLLVQSGGVIKQPMSKKTFEVDVFTSADLFNQAMITLGRTPGEDCFRLVEIPEGFFSPRTYVETVSRGEVPIAGRDSLAIRHDRDLTDHVQSWWSLPTGLVPAIREQATRALETNDETNIKNFAHGLDVLSEVARTLVPKFHILLKDAHALGKDIDEQVECMLETVANTAMVHAPYSKRPKDLNCEDDIIRSFALFGLIDINIDRSKDGHNKILWPRVGKAQTVDASSPIVHAVREDVGMIMLSYLSNFVDITTRLDDVVGARSEAEAEQFRQIAARLQISLESGQAQQQLTDALEGVKQFS